MKVTVLGCGRWGTFLAWYAARVGHDVLLWGREGSEKLRQLQETRRNAYLTLPSAVALGGSLAEAVGRADIAIISIGSQALRSLAGELAAFDLADKTFVLCMKGLEIGSGKRLSEVFGEAAGANVRVAVWVGPGHVQDFTKDIPNCMIVGARSAEISREVVEAFGSPLIRFYYGEDLLGIEIGAAAKNVVGIAAGMLDGLRYGSLKGALMARGAKELSRLIKAMGGDPMTVYGLSHLGDYEATLFSPHSNNRRFGEDFVIGRRFDKLAEGVYTVEALLSLAERYGVELPISRAVHEIIARGEDPKKKLLDLFLRPVKAE